MLDLYDEFRGLITAFEAAGVEYAVCGGLAMAIHVTKVQKETGDELSVDLLVVTPAMHSVWETRRDREWEGLALWVVSREGLAQLKRLRGSGQDQDDIQWLTKQKED